MSHKDVGGRRLKLGAVLGATRSVLPRLWVGAGGALLMCLAVSLVPMVAALEGWVCIAWWMGMAATGLVAIGALARISVSDDLTRARTLGLGPLGLQFGWPETRLVGAALLCFIFLAIVLAVLVLVVLAIFGVAELNVAAIQSRDWAEVGAPWKLAVLALVGGMALAVPLLLTVRLSLFVPATLGRDQMVSLNAMGIAYGSFWQLLGGLIVTGLPTITLLALISTGLVSGRIVSAVGVVVLIGLQLPLTLGFLGAAYRQLEYWTREEAGR